MFAAARMFPACSFHLLPYGEQQEVWQGNSEGGCEPPEQETYLFILDLQCG